jgi:CheY-like chemotaxis protein/two-component sensor histidine kinase
MEQQLLQAQKMEAVGHLAGGVAHDFRNQLQVIKGFSELLLREGHVSDEGRELVEEVLQAVERSTRLTTSLLAFGRREVLRPEVVDLSTIVTELSKSLSRIIGEDIRLTIDTCQGPCRANVDPAQLQQALVNLVVNAREAMPRGGAIQLETRTVRIDTHSPLADQPPPGHYAAVAVRDDGIGMDDDTLARAFEPFFTTKGRERGTGLGLSMVYGFVRQSGGTVRTESRLHEGTTIELLFPLTEADIEPRLSPSDQADTPALSGTVLVCEDEDAVRKMITAACAEAGLEVIEAAGPTEALQQARALQEPVDLLLTDVVMPDGSGTRLADELRQHWPGLAVLYVTGYPGKELARRNLGVRGETTLRKPFSRNKLIQAIGSLLSSRQSPAAS